MVVDDTRATVEFGVGPDGRVLGGLGAVGKKAVETPWLRSFHNYRMFDGIRVPPERRWAGMGRRRGSRTGGTGLPTIPLSGDFPANPRHRARPTLAQPLTRPGSAARGG